MLISALGPSGIVIIVQNILQLGSLRNLGIQKLLYVECFAVAHAGMPRGIENHQGTVRAGISHILIGQCATSESIGKHPGVGHNTVSQVQTVCGQSISGQISPDVGHTLISRRISVENRMAFDLDERFRRLCSLKADPQFHFLFGFDSVNKGVALGNGGSGNQPATHIADGLFNGKEILPCG